MSPAAMSKHQPGDNLAQPSGPRSGVNPKTNQPWLERPQGTINGIAVGPNSPGGVAQAAAATRGRMGGGAVAGSRGDLTRSNTSYEERSPATPSVAKHTRTQHPLMAGSDTPQVRALAADTFSGRFGAGTTGARNMPMGTGAQVRSALNAGANSYLGNTGSAAATGAGGVLGNMAGGATPSRSAPSVPAPTGGQGAAGRPADFGPLPVGGPAGSSASAERASKSIFGSGRITSHGGTTPTQSMTSSDPASRIQQGPNVTPVRPDLHSSRNYNPAVYGQPQADRPVSTETMGNRFGRRPEGFRAAGANSPSLAQMTNATTIQPNSTAGLSTAMRNFQGPIQSNPWAVNGALTSPGESGYGRNLAMEQQRRYDSAAPNSSSPAARGGPMGPFRNEANASNESVQKTSSIRQETHMNRDNFVSRLGPLAATKQASPDPAYIAARLAGRTVGYGGIGGVMGAIAGATRGNTPEGIGRGLVRGGAVGLGSGVGSLIPQLLMDHNHPATLPLALAGGVGGGLAGWMGSGKLLGEPRGGKKKDESNEKQDVKQAFEMPSGAQLGGIGAGGLVGAGLGNLAGGLIGGDDDDDDPRKEKKTNWGKGIGTVLGGLAGGWAGNEYLAPLLQKYMNGDPAAAPPAPPYKPVGMMNAINRANTSAVCTGDDAVDAFVGRESLRPGPTWGAPGLSQTSPMGPPVPGRDNPFPPAANYPTYPPPPGSMGPPNPTKTGAIALPAPPKMTPVATPKLPKPAVKPAVPSIKTGAPIDHAAERLGWTVPKTPAPQIRGGDQAQPQQATPAAKTASSSTQPATRPTADWGYMPRGDKPHQVLDRNPVLGPGGSLGRGAGVGAYGNADGHYVNPRNIPRPGNKPAINMTRPGGPAPAPPKYQPGPTKELLNKLSTDKAFNVGAALGKLASFVVDKVNDANKPTRRRLPTPEQAQRLLEQLHARSSRRVQEVA